MRNALTWIELKLWDFAIPAMSSSPRVRLWLQKTYRALRFFSQMPRALLWALGGLGAGLLLGALILRLQ
jgi:Flp pilus assembly protein TadB